MSKPTKDVSQYDQCGRMYGKKEISRKHIHSAGVSIASLQVSQLTYIYRIADENRFMPDVVRKMFTTEEREKGLDEGKTKRIPSANTLTYNQVNVLSGFILDELGRVTRWTAKNYEFSSHFNHIDLLRIQRRIETIHRVVTEERNKDDVEAVMRLDAEAIEIQKNLIAQIRALGLQEAYARPSAGFNYLQRLRKSGTFEGMDPYNHFMLLQVMWQLSEMEYGHGAKENSQIQRSLQNDMDRVSEPYGGENGLLLRQRAYHQLEG